MTYSSFVPAQQVFSLEEVNALVPELTRVVTAQLDLRGRIEALLDELAEVTGTRGDVTPRADDSPDVRDKKRAIARSIDTYQRGWSEVEAMGGVLKDPRLGLVDFYGNVGGKLVWLCWKLGENKVSHWHELDQGFAARKPIQAMLN